MTERGNTAALPLSDYFNRLVRKLFFVAVFTAHRPFFHFGMATFTGFVSPVLAEIRDLAGAFFMTLLAVLEHLLVFLVREGNFAH
jgi:hypothetical protein